jgi:hypothetical protein
MVNIINTSTEKNKELLNKIEELERLKEDGISREALIDKLNN